MTKCVNGLQLCNNFPIFAETNDKTTMSQPIIVRTLRCLALMSGNTVYTIDELSRKLGVSTRTVYRYIDTFKEAGFSVSRHGDYEYHVDSLGDNIEDISNVIYFSDAEAQIVNRLIDSLDPTNSLKAGLKKKLAAIYDSTNLAERIDNKNTAKKVEILVDAIREKKVVELRDYVSSYAGQTRTFKVEPYKFTSNYTDVWALDCKSGINKRIKILRIGEVVKTDESWSKEYAHHDEPMDAFHCFGPDEYHVVIKLNNAARNIMVEEFPLTEPDIKPIPDCVIGGELDQAWQYEGICRHLWGIGRFCLGQQLNIEVVECDALKNFMLQSADNILYTYGVEE